MDCKKKAPQLRGYQGYSCFVRFYSRLDCSPSAAMMAMERTQTARRRRQAPAGKLGGSFIAKVIWNKRDPIIKLPSRTTRSDLPHGDTDVRLSDNAMWTFRLMKEFINVARPVGSQQNQLPDLLREWFGPAAGHPGTRFQVRFLPTPDGWWAEPLDPLPDHLGRSRLTAFLSLEAAAGAGSAMVGVPRGKGVQLPGHWPGCFAVRVSGDSMDGGTSPMRDGDWAILRWARSASLAAIGDRVALVAVGQPDAGVSHHLKRLGRVDDVFVLRSDNPVFPPRPVSGTTQVLALRQAIIRPEALAPPVGTVLNEADLCDAFSVPQLPEGAVIRAGGHLFFRISTPGAFSESDRLTLPLPDRRPGECAYILTAHHTDQWRYSGVGRWNGEQWCLPALDFATWRALGKGRSASKRLESRWRDAAETFVRAKLQAECPRWVEARGRRCRLVGKAARGGLRIDGGKGGFTARTVSLTDLAWVLAARDRFAGQPLDEAAVNRLRYLAGTPKGSTRWIDTGWAMVLTEQATL